MKSKRCIILITFVLLFASLTTADVRPHKLISSNMVLQRETQVKIWGWADPGEKVTVGPSWQSFPIKSVKADKNGKWSVKIQTLQAGGPHKLTIKGKNTITLDNILFGEVWVSSGQSNMEMPLANVSNAYTGIKDYEKEIAAANHPQIRLFQVDKFASKETVEDIQTGITMYGVPLSTHKWQVCSPETIPNFAATAYFFARKIHLDLGIPVGIIDASWGGIAAEAMTPAEGLKKLGYTNALEHTNGKPQAPRRAMPTRLYNGMIHPLTNYTIKGAIWYQGESNSRSANKYQALMSTMITCWRNAWDLGDFPFYYAQIAPYKYGPKNPSQYLREAQMKTLSLKNTGMAVTMDIANLTDIHPKNKQDVGKRLALWALNKDYAKKIVFSGPIYRSMEVEGNKIRLKFDYTGSGLATNDGKSVSHLTIAGPDMQFVPAKGIIEGDTLVVSSESVKKPVAVRYAWSNTDQPNLANKEGLPASSFRTDN